MSLHMTTLKPLIRRGRTPGVVIQMHNTWQVRFDLPRQQWSLLNRFRTDRDTAVPAEGNGDLQTLICVLVARPRRCLTLSNPVP